MEKVVTKPPTISSITEYLRTYLSNYIITFYKVWTWCLWTYSFRDNSQILTEVLNYSWNQNFINVEQVSAGWKRLSSRAAITRRFPCVSSSEITICRTCIDKVDGSYNRSLLVFASMTQTTHPKVCLPTQV